MPRPPGRLGAHLGLLAGLLVAVALAQAVLGRGSTGALVLFGATEAAAALVAAAASRARARLLPAGSARRSWALFAGACAAWGLGQVLFAAQDVAGLDTPSTSWFDVPFTAWGLLLIASGAAHLRGRVRAHHGVRALLDGALLGLGLLTVVWVLWLGDAVAAHRGPAVGLVAPLGYPLVDVVFLVATLVAVARGGGGRTVLLVVGGACLGLAADASYAYGAVSAAGFSTGGPADLAWIAGFGLYALAARHDREPPVPRSETRTPARDLLVPYAALAPATLCAAVRLWSGPDRVVLVLALAGVLLAMVRQFLVLDDHRRLLRVAEQQRAALDALAHVDPLTGLENRRRFGERLQEAVRAALAQGRPVLVAFVDLDRFKQVNDTLGHQAGDDLLRGVADRLRGCLRTGDCAARWGGDEFAFLVTDPGVDAAAVVARLRAAMSEPFEIAGTRVRATASIGAVAEDPRDLPVSGPPAAVVEALLAAADARMYAVKRARRDPAAAGG
ncbi:diguanylate cyclase [Kineococcus sp. T13]|uniref:diguanylate cyclase domain-containing protein n=1 Tax=Kineococcus vitellinus TaxID=2696565 RepID=UPI0014135B3B|nr:diguanylate cyclase [Kineococcus vitellinus]